MKNCDLKIIFLTFALGLFLTGCTSPPRQVQASIPLVDPSPKQHSIPLGQELPLIFWKHLSIDGSAEMSNSAYDVFANQPYISALGLLCRKLIITDIKSNVSEKRIACSRSLKDELTELTPWYLMRDIQNPTSDPQL